MTLAFATGLAQPPRAPLMVFGATQDEHALSAFDGFALDRLLKPFDAPRFAALLGLKRRAALQREALQAWVREQHRRAAGTGLPERIAAAEIDGIAAAGKDVSCICSRPTAGAPGRMALRRRRRA